jgi:type I restriction enzyme S subunit
MSDLKPGWQRVKFGEVVRQVKDKVDPGTSGIGRFVAGEHMDTDDLRIRRWGDVGDGYLGPAFNMRFKPGQVLYGSRRTYLRKVAVADFEGICANTTFILETKNPTELLPELLPFIMSMDAFHEHSKRESKGSVNPYVNFSDLAWFEFGLPPLDEQRRLVRIFSAAADMVDTARLSEEAGKIAVESALSSLVSGGSNRIPGSKAFIADANLPKDWRLLQIKEICSERVTSGTTPRTGKSSTNTGHPFLRVQNLKFDGGLQFDDAPEWIEQAEFTETSSRHALPGDILINTVGPPLGKVSVIPRDFPEALFNQAIVRYRIQDPLLRTFATAYLFSSWSKDWLFANSTKTSGQRNINVNTASNLPIAIPPPSAMADISSKITSLLNTFQGCRDRLAQAERLASSLLSAGLTP